MAVQGRGRRVAKRLPAAAVGCRSISRNPPFGCDGDWRRHHRSPAMATRPAGQDSARAIRAGNDDSTAPFRPESQSFLDHLVAGFRPNGSWSDPRRAQCQGPMELVLRQARIRHITVRILYAQPATAVSPREFRVLTEVPIFP